jgi:hypothetical protein
MGNYFACKYFKSLKIARSYGLVFSICKVRGNKKAKEFLQSRLFFKGLFSYIAIYFLREEDEKRNPK